MPMCNTYCDQAGFPPNAYLPVPYVAAPTVSPYAYGNYPRNCFGNGCGGPCGFTNNCCGNPYWGNGCGRGGGCGSGLGLFGLIAGVAILGSLFRGGGCW